MIRTAKMPADFARRNSRDSQAFVTLGRDASGTDGR